MPGVNYGRAVMKMRPDWQPGQTARPLDVVYYQNCLWACIRETSALPSASSADWMLSVRSVESDLTGAAEGQVLTIVKVGQELKAQYKALPAYGINDINGLAAALAGKSPTNHTHAAGDINGAVLASRKITATAPLSGGGDLSADRAFKLDYGKGLKVESNKLVLSVLQGGGLVMDNQTGELYFDPSQMPTDKFEALLKSIRVPIWLARNTTWYVDPVNGNNANDGLTAATAFKTIKYALDQVCGNYNFGAYAATILLAPGTYAEGQITIPNYTATTGSLTIRGQDRAEVFVDATDGAALFRTMPSARAVTLNGMTLRYTVSAGGSSSTIKSLVHIASYSSVTLSGCACQYAENANAIGNREMLRLEASGAFTIAAGNRFELTSELAPGGGINVFSAYTSANVYMSNNAVVNGDFMRFINLNGGIFNRAISTAPVFSTETGCTGLRYRILNGGRCLTNGGGPDFLPGSIAGTVSDSPAYN